MVRKIWPFLTRFAETKIILNFFKSDVKFKRIKVVAKRSVGLSSKINLPPR